MSAEVWGAAVMALLAGIAWLIRLVRRSDRHRTALAAAERAARIEWQRREIEDDIQQDADLAARARRVGLVRPDR